MQSVHQDALLQLFRKRPRFAVELIERLLHQPLPFFNRMRVEPVVLVHTQRAHRAPAVVLLLNEQPVFGIVVATQLFLDDDEALLWPLYAYHLRASVRCQVVMLVVAPDAVVAQRSAAAIDLGPGNLFRPWVLGPSRIPEITVWEQARAEPELAILSALAHGRDENTAKAVTIALNAIAASIDLDPESSIVYVDLIYDALSEEAREQATKPENF